MAKPTQQPSLFPDLYIDKRPTGERSAALRYQEPSLLTAIAEAQPKKRRYRTTLRPAAGGGLPQGVTWSYIELPNDGTVIGRNLPTSRHRYGVIETSRELTADEMRHFDIVAI